MAEQAAKRLKTDGISIATHNGHFHADEALAVHMLRRHVPDYAGASLVRTRDPAKLAESHTVVDVGGEYDADKLRFDHHQRGFTTTFPGRPTKLSSAGLVYMHFGRGIIERSVRSQKVADTDVDLLYNKLYSGFIEALDAHDNGIDAYDPAELAAANGGAGIAKRYTDGGFTLGAVVGRYNAQWNDADEDQATEDARFEKASARIGVEFDRELNYLVSGWLPARSIVKAAFDARSEFDSGGRLLVFRDQSCPWKDHLYTLESEAGEGSSKVLYVLYPDKEGRWRVQCVPAAKDSFESRRPLPEAWRGHRDDALDKILDGAVAPGAVFVHASGFIGGHRTFEGALQMAKKSLEL
ncbi:MYG1 protein [Sporothrix schenckii 1099-18]|uniref:MYG1 protein n=1 Tax=Sporothrix schenckii 1099-18 TaxID=1397361 RepID=A0A0F2M4R6_SPOSC|nr:MYG1 protein [Sporothrix schenckii 1099-18]KJR84612.1 MYG1 protein [Sporothrix schenckii 1099-18]